MSSTVKGKLLLKEELGPASIEEDLRCFYLRKIYVFYS